MGEFSLILMLVAGAAAFVAYWIPTLIALARGHHQALPIILVNMLLGWTGIGWMGALIWSVSAKRE